MVTAVGHFHPGTRYGLAAGLRQPDAAPQETILIKHLGNEDSNLD